jgi:ribosomal protein S18 acetylase RimI-like enzyme
LLFGVEIRELSERELPFGAALAARGLRDNPIAVTVLGDDPLHRERSLMRTFLPFMEHQRHPALAAWRGDYVVGVVGMAPPGRCQLSPVEVVKMLPRVRPNPRDMRRTIKWLNEWQRRDPGERHWHVGPVAVEGGMRGLGIGGRLMEAFGEQMDRAGDVAYLETDKPENVSFYQRFAFEVIEEAQVLGIPNWFMLRRPS